MNQILRLPPSGVCYYFPLRHSHRSSTCSRCLGPHKFWALDPMYYSTYESTVLKNSLRRRKNVGPFGKRLKETELLKVTDKQASEKTMTVGKLDASFVTAFAKEPGMILNNIRNSRYKRGMKKKVAPSGVFHKEQSHSSVRSSNSPNYMNESVLRISESRPEIIKKPKKFSKIVNNDHHSHSYSDFDRSTSEKINYSTIVPNSSSYTHGMYLNHGPDSKFKTISEGKEEKGSDGIKSEGLKTEEYFSEVTGDAPVMSSPSDLLALFHVKNCNFDEMDRSDQLVLSLVDVCVNNGMLQNAFELLYRSKGKNPQSSFKYDILLRGYSEEGKWSEVQKILWLMEEHKVPFSCETFALSLECLYRIPEGIRYKKKKAKELLTNFQLMGYKIADLFETVRSNYYKRKNILEIVNWIFPEFNPSSPSFLFEGDSRLVADLYDNDYVLKPLLPCFTAKEMAKAVEEQLTLETKSFCEVESVVKRGTCCPEHRKDWIELVELWKRDIQINFSRHLNALKEEVKGKSHIPNLYPFLNCLPQDDFVNLMLHEINRLCLTSEGYTVNTNAIYRTIGSRVWYRYCVRKKIKNNELMGKYKDFIYDYCSWLIEPDEHTKCARQKWLTMMWDNPDTVKMGERNILWPDAVRIKIGKFLFDIILKSAIIPSSLLYPKNQKKAIPAFYLVLRYNKDQITEQVKFHPTIGLLYRRANLNTLFFDVEHLPMFCPPKPWISIDSGGFYILPTHFLRPTKFNYNLRILRSVRTCNLNVIFDSLNQLQSIPWVVNERVLDIALEVFREGGSTALNVPVYPDMSPLPEPEKCMDSIERAAAYKERLKILSNRQADFGLWCECLYKLSLANHCRNKTFWLPHNLDFRGRVYPVPPHINHTASDLYRSLFLFAKKEPLGENGLDWLKIHVINLTGAFNKKPLQQRLNHANEVLGDILDSAERPLNGRGWWTESEDPWQTLAACFEIRNALHCDNPGNYKTGFPVHQDGSCNGLQHYAALGRDSIGAASVNLAPSDEPQDVYTVVANLIEEIREKDARKGVEIASVLEGFVTRKVIKQTVMTTVYGVTSYGAKLQIKNRLEDKSNFPERRIMEAATYLSAKVFEALKEMFTSAREIQDWLLNCADVISETCGESVSWVTPIGLPVIQPYFKETMNSRETLVNLLPDKRKQKNAFPPNFIHSLDSSHMMLTALYCGKAGLHFASIHDCFWTHPSNIDIMSRICREKFIALHSEEILSDLAEHFLKMYKTPKSTDIYTEFMKIPGRGDFDLKNVLNSVYFFS